MATSPLSQIQVAAARRLIGVHVAPESVRVSGVVIAVTGRGLDCRATLLTSAYRELTPDWRDAFDRAVTSGGPSTTVITDLSAALVRELADVVNQLLAQSANADVLAVGVHGTGLWSCDDEDNRTDRLELCNAARLAEATGQNVIDAFADRDLAGGGQGGPLDALPKWALLHDAEQNRCLVDFGSIVRVVYLPAGVEPHVATRVMATDVGPGLSLIEDMLKAIVGNATVPGIKRNELSENRAFELGIHSICPQSPQAQAASADAITTEQVDIALHNVLIAACTGDETTFQWYPHSAVFNKSIKRVLREAIQSGLNATDILRTATCVVANMTARAIYRHIPRTPPLSTVLVYDEDAKNELLLQDLSQQLEDIAIARVGELFDNADNMSAVNAALLALLHIDQVPATHTLTTGILAPRVLGRLTPGTPSSWQRLVRHLAANVPVRMSLRSAM